MAIVYDKVAKNNICKIYAGIVRKIYVGNINHLWLL